MLLVWPRFCLDSPNSYTKAGPQSALPTPHSVSVALPGAGLFGRPELVLVLRCLLGVRSGAPDWKTFLELEAHLERRRGTEVWRERQSGVIEVQYRVRAAGVAMPRPQAPGIIVKDCSHRLTADNLCRSPLHLQALKTAKAVAADGSEDELLQRICGILDVNSFEVRGPSSAAQPGTVTSFLEYTAARVES